MPTCYTEEYLVSKSDHQENEHSSLQGTRIHSIVNSNLSNTGTKNMLVSLFSITALS